MGQNVSNKIYIISKPYIYTNIYIYIYILYIYTCYTVRSVFLRIIILLYDKTRSSIGAPLWVTILKPPKQQLFLLILGSYAAISSDFMHLFLVISCKRHQRPDNREIGEKIQICGKPYGTVQNRSGPLKTVMSTLFPIQDRSPKSKPFGLRSKYVQITFKLRSITFKLRKNYVNIT